MTMAPRLRWPLPAVLAWAACWVVYTLGARFGLSGAAAVVIAATLGLLLSLASTHWCSTRAAGSATA